MRRIDVLGVGLLIFLTGGSLYLLLRTFGFDNFDAGVWSQAIFLVGILGWVGTYLFRVVSGKMTYNQQRDDYETAVLQKQLDEMSPEALAQLQAELEQDKQTHDP
ncbi:MAG: DUF3007 family protein [Thermosynechococcaceae cyanobacterium MS004]|nr:DUF3007 family protein [Thermosynechococcaceae cyanobacterium MS004]